MSSARREHGSASIWVVACCALLMSIAGAVTVRTLAVLARHRAETSADLAALAGAGQIGVGGRACAAAARVAARNGARLRTCVVRLAPDGRSGTVSVRVEMAARLPIVGSREILATARAAREPGPAAAGVAEPSANSGVGMVSVNPT
jgi:secretion/DNA translocation related TadE-like protein